MANSESELSVGGDLATSPLLPIENRVREPKLRKACRTCLLKRKASSSAIKATKRGKNDGEDQLLQDACSWEQVVAMIDNGYMLSFLY
jgi:hypothetical protein